jgi:hypothetical protein
MTFYEGAVPTIPEGLTEQTQRIKDLVTQIFDSRYDYGESSALEAPMRAELDAMPREALVGAAWQGIANYHRQLTIWGDTPKNQRLEQEKEYRKSLLTPDEEEITVNFANGWLDACFDK